MAKTKKSAEDIHVKVKAYMLANERLLNRHSLISRQILRFPKYQKLPLILRFALRIIGKYGAVIDTEFTLK
jgi:hypothetical protein